MKGLRLKMTFSKRLPSVIHKRMTFAFVCKKYYYCNSNIIYKT